MYGNDYKRSIWKRCMYLYTEGLAVSDEFINKGKAEEFGTIIPSRVEFAAGARYLHRGYYCPCADDIVSYILVNARKGKLLKRPNKNTKLTHKFLFDEMDRIYMVEYLPNSGASGIEYILRKDGYVFGVLIDCNGKLLGISVETYQNNRLQEYIWITGHYTDNEYLSWESDYVRYITLKYNENNLPDEAHLHFVALYEDEFSRGTDINELVGFEIYKID